MLYSRPMRQERLIRLVLFLLLPFALLTFAICFGGTAPKAVLIYPTAGTVLTPGQLVHVRWTVQDPDSQKFCEQEIFMTVKGTRYQISPEMGYRTRRYNWYVPNIPGNAVIDLHLGCERGSRWEASFPQPNNWFTIKAVDSTN
jgi:hypothetical protein